MARSLICLSGRRRVASALGAGVLAGSLTLVGCSSSSPKGGGDDPTAQHRGLRYGFVGVAGGDVCWPGWCEWCCQCWCGDC